MRSQPGGTIVEPTSGNTGVGLALVAQTKGYRCVFVCPDKVSLDKQNVLRAYGAEVVVCPTAVDPEDPRSYYSVSDRLVREIPGAWKPDQYSNPNNPRSHYETTGPELWEQTDGRITHFVAGVGTGGTISGTGRYLKEVSGGAVQGHRRRPRRLGLLRRHRAPVPGRGRGRGLLADGVRPRASCDEIVAVSDRDSFLVTRRLAREEGLLVGGSCGMAVQARARGGRARVEGRRHRGAAARRRPRLPVEGVQRRLDGRLRLPADLERPHASATCCGRSPARCRSSCTRTRRRPCARPSTSCAHYGVSQMPVVKAEPPVKAAEVVGSVVERDLLDALFGGHAELADPVEKHMSAGLPMIGAGEPVSAAVAALESADAAIVVDDGLPTGVVTRQDLLGYLTH